MRQKDIMLIAVIVIVSGLASFFLARALFQSPEKRQVQAEVVAPITTDFTLPSTKYFNANALNPTQQIQIGDSANVTPFSGR